ncbi:TPA: hypothetical protein ACIZB4_001240 [Legionella pneumophila]|uniref:Secreted protein n=4 Tax=Legionella TaxID=445 RepID=A0A222P325_9GAMM|nr:MULTISPECIES: hypothetical protein [Legionellaceae]MCH9059080.1 hypothetical protein [Legionella pneumophila serogroup 1]NSL17525.1 hypothetical protein [Legionella micdadei]AGN13904.1 hypothetical protein LP6_0990 [Legionella pneumophila subsp. pneumophila str. Thunder Bay]AMP90289.1 hypothetical protein AXF35_11565 [Legionella pneumophila subsp. pascullei]AMP92044.1 hypothetical protein AXF36_05235 [Legionella pneumophila subsp. pascullei]
MKKFAITLMSLIFINSYYPTAFSEKPNQRMMNNQSTHSLKSKNTLQLSIQEIMDKKDKKLVLIKLIDTKSNKPITLNDLIEAHTQKIHLLIIDDTLLDYSHVHPVETTIPGIYQFEWQPTLKSASYRAWADLIPTNTKTQEYVVADLPYPKTKKKLENPIHRQPLFESSVDGYHFKLSFDKTPLHVGQAVMGKIDITDAKENPVHTLEPIMGAYAHIVGFNEDFKTVTHVHPMGKEPTNNTERGGPELLFHIKPNKVGFIKMFAQVQIDGKTLFVPFGVTVNS